MTQIHARYVRHRLFLRLRHSNNFNSFLDDQAARLSGTGTGTAITFTNATNSVNLTDHGIPDGQGPFMLANSGGALPAALDTTSFYWVKSINVNAFTLHLTEADAIAGTSIIALAGDGTGTHNLLFAAEDEDIFASMVAGKTSEQIAGLTSIDGL